MACERLSQKHLTAPNYGEFPAEQNANFANVSLNHVESFNWAINHGLQNVIRSLRTLRFKLSSSPNNSAALLSEGESSNNIPTVSVRLSDPNLRSPFDETRSRPITPAECRNKHRTYQGLLTIKVTVEFDGIEVFSSERSFGEVPIMLRSQKCTLYKLTPKQLVSAGEDAEEFGGYFIVNGIEKVLRYLVAMRRNFPFCIKRGGWRSRDKHFSDKGVMIRCVDRCESNAINVLHYLTNGTAVLQVSRRRELFYLPIMLVFRCLCDISDREIYCATLRDGLENDSFARSCVSRMLQQMHLEHLGNRQECIQFVASQFRGKLRAPAWYSSEQVVQQFLDEAVLPHLSPYPNRVSEQIEQRANRAKAELLCYMLRRLLVFAQGLCMAESPDSLSNQEVISASGVWLCILRDSLERSMYGMQREINLAYQRSLGRLKRAHDDAGETTTASGKKRGVGRKSSTAGGSGDSTFQRIVMEAFVRMAFNRASSDLAYVFATGNVPRLSHVQLHQLAGLTVTAERINMQRFMSHFRAVHRGQYFTQLRTTECRRLSGEAWGFICPVHTPDGAPCGLLNHLSAYANVVALAGYTEGVKAAPASYGMISCDLTTTTTNTEFVTDIEIDAEGDATASKNNAKRKKFLFDPNFYDVLIDGQPIGRISSKYVERAVDELRYRKCDQNDLRIPTSMEICLIRHTPYASQFSGLYIFCHANRLIRPVVKLNTTDSPSAPKLTEWIGTFEQVYLNIAVYDNEILLDDGSNSVDAASITTHQEICPQAILSIIAALTPFSEMNPSPRNMYQCQMGKQTLGVATLAIPYRADTKLYQLETPQSPMVRAQLYDQYEMDTFPIGTNAVVAVIAYSGYSMEDAVVMNRASVERGFAYGSIIKNEHVDVVREARERSSTHSNFAFGFLRQQQNKETGTTAPPQQRFSTMLTPHELQRCHILLDAHGLPRVGARLYKNDPFYCVVDLESKEQQCCAS